MGEALESVLAHRSDRQILVYLRSQGEEVRYEILRRAIGEKSPQSFKYAISRLSGDALINRRLEERGERFASFISLTNPGKSIATLLIELHSALHTMPGDFPRQLREEAQHALLEPVAPM